MRTLLLGALLAAGAARSAANLPPVAVAGASTTEPLTRAAVSFSSAGSSDPDSGPGPLTFAWDFDDGSPADGSPAPTHAFAAARVHNVTLTVSDGLDSSVATVRVYVLAPPTPAPPVKSGPLALDAGRAELWAVNEDSGSVSVVSLVSRTLLAELPVGRGPRALAFDAPASRLLATLGEDGALAVIDPAARRVSSVLPLCHGPAGIAIAPGSGKVVVACEDDAALLVLDGPSLLPRATLAVGPGPRAVAISHDGGRAVLTHFVTRGDSGRATLIDLDAEAVDRAAALASDPGPDTPSSGRGYPNLLGEVAIDPAGTHAWLGGLKSNSDRGLFREGVALVPSNRVRGLIAPVELATGADAIGLRVDLNNADSATGLGWSANGRWLFAVHPGTGELTVLDVPVIAAVRRGDGSAIPFAARLAAGDGPHGLVRDGTLLYTLAFLDRSVSVLDVADPRAPRLLASIPLTLSEPLPAAVLDGKRMFHRSQAPIHSEGGYIACASCHPDGGRSDGRVWDFTQAGEGLRNTTDLRGRKGTGHGPVHWSANFDEIQDFENDIVDGFGGTGLARDGLPPHPPMGVSNAGRSAELDGLAAYVASLTRAPDSPFRDPAGGLSAAARRGREVFYRPATACAQCHTPPEFTLSALPPSPFAYRLFDVGTLAAGSGGRLGGALPGIDVPTLKGAWDGAPYLHAGQAATLREVLTTENPADRHGRTSQLTAGEIDDLERFLLELDEGPDVLPAALPASLPGEVSPPGAPVPLLAVKRGSVLELSFGLEPRAAAYRVVRGRIGAWDSHTADLAAGAGACDAGTGRSFADRDDLADGQSWYYLAGAFNPLGEGTYGAGRTSRLPSGDCP